jgi:hypothetical protein
MQINEITPQVPQGARLPLAQQPDAPRPKTETRSERTGSDASRRPAVSPPTDAAAPRRYGAGF